MATKKTKTKKITKKPASAKKKATKGKSALDAGALLTRAQKAEAEVDRLSVEVRNLKTGNNIARIVELNEEVERLKNSGRAMFEELEKMKEGSALKATQEVAHDYERDVLRLQKENEDLSNRLTRAENLIADQEKDKNELKDQLMTKMVENPPEVVADVIDAIQAEGLDALVLLCADESGEDENVRATTAGRVFMFLQSDMNVYAGEGPAVLKKQLENDIAGGTEKGALANYYYHLLMGSNDAEARDAAWPTKAEPAPTPAAVGMVDGNGAVFDGDMPVEPLETTAGEKVVEGPVTTEEVEKETFYVEYIEDDQEKKVEIEIGIDVLEARGEDDAIKEAFMAKTGLDPSMIGGWHDNATEGALAAANEGAAIAHAALRAERSES